MKVLCFPSILIALFGLLTISTESLEASDPPNILLIIAEDTGPHFNAYQDVPIETPGVDRLASEGMLFTNAYGTQATCSPARSSIWTGLFPHQNGHLGLANRGFMTYEGVPNVVEALREKGYYCANYGKLHVHPEDQFPFHVNKRGNWRDVEWLAEQADAAVRRARGNPFFLTISIFDAHRPFRDQFEGLPETPVKADEATPFGFFGGVDTPEVREEVAGYYNALARVDTGVNLLLDVLEDRGLAEDTIVLFLSDHGPAFSRGKVTTYDGGVNIPWVVRWPGRISGGSVSNKLVSATDVMPTILELIGEEVPEYLPGRSHLPLFENPGADWRTHVFAEFNSHQPYFWPQRMVRDDRYKLIHNIKHDGPKPGLGIDGCKVRPAALAGNYPDRAAGAYSILLEDQPKLELYDLAEDPDELNNLAEDPAYADIRAELATELADWQERTRDPVRARSGLQIFSDYYAENGDSYEAFVIDGSKAKIDWSPFHALQWPVSLGELELAFTPSEAVIHEERNGRVVVEAEAFGSQENDDTLNWSDMPGSQIEPKPVGSYLESTGINGTMTGYGPGEAGVLNYAIYFNNPGRYYLHVRSVSSENRPGTLYFGLNGNWSEVAMADCGFTDSWYWCSRASDYKSDPGANSFYLDVDTAGLHTVSFSVGEAGVKFDRFMLSMEEPMERPWDRGPEASPLAGSAPRGNAWWFDHATEMEEGWFSMDKFSRFRRIGETGWIEHIKLGLTFVSDNNNDGFWFWQENLGWMWTSGEGLPFAFQAETEEWIWFYFDDFASPDVWFYRTVSGIWDQVASVSYDARTPSEGGIYSILNRWLTETDGGLEFIEVTNLQSDGEGSLNQAIDDSDPDKVTIITFAVSGWIDAANWKWTATLVDKPYIWFAGQTAPSPGVAILGGTRLRGGSAENLVFDHLRFRRLRHGEGSGNTNKDGVTLSGKSGSIRNVLFRNCSFSWSTDELLTSHATPMPAFSSGIVVEHCLLAEGFPEHAYGTLQYGGFEVAWLSNWWGSFSRRFPNVNGGAQAHIQNNLLSNCGTTDHKAAGHGYSILFNYAGSTRKSYDPITRHNIVAVVFEDGPDVTQQKWIVPPWEKASSMRDLWVDNDWWSYGRYGWMTYHDGTSLLNGQVMRTPDTVGEYYRSHTPFYRTTDNLLPVSEVRAHVSRYAGAWPADRCPTDKRITEDLLARTHTRTEWVDNGTEPPDDPPIAEHTHDITYPVAPLATSSDGVLTNVERWLHDLHVHAGGADQFDGPQWIQWSQNGYHRLYTPTREARSRQEKEFLVFKGERVFSESDRGFHYYYRNSQPFPTTWPENWRDPVDFWGGHLAIRIVLKTTPESQPVNLQACIWMHDADGTSTTADELESCSGVRTHMTGRGVYEIETNPFRDWWHKNQGRNAIDLSRPDDFKRMGLVLRTASGCYISPYNITPNCWDEREEYLPMKFEVIIVAVSEGAEFSGWENYVGADAN